MHTLRADSRLHSEWDFVGGLRIHARVSASRQTPPAERPAPNTPGQTQSAERRTRIAPPIVFVHGLGVSSRYMEPTMDRLADDYPVAALDLAGFGRSATPSRAFTLAEHARTLEQWLDVRAIGPAVLVGNSYGCQVIVECVSHAPHRALGLVLNAPTMDPAHRSALAMIARVIADVPLEPWRLAVIVARDYWRAGPRRLLTTLTDALRDRIEEKLPAITQPTLVVCGARDPVVTVGWASECARLVGLERPGAAGGTMQCVATAAHALPYDDPATFAAVIGNFVEHGMRAPASVAGR